MKVTSYKISKELWDLGLNIEPIMREFEGKDYRTPCYDLETILDVLPYSIRNNGFDYFLNLNQYCIAYENNEPETDGDLYGQVRLTHEDTNEFLESLADTAARLLMKLIKDKIIEL